MLPIPNPLLHLPRFTEYLQQVGHAVELSHAQVVFLFRHRGSPGIAEEQHPDAASRQVFHLVAEKLVAQRAALHTLISGAGSRLTILVRHHTVVSAADALDVLGGIVLMTEDLPPAVDHLLPYRGIIRARRAEVATITAVTDHFFQFFFLLVS